MSDMKVVKVEYTRTCPWCGAQTDASTNTTSAAEPEAGDVGLCWTCLNFSIFIAVSDELHFRMPTDEEMQEIMADPEAARTQAQAKRWKARIDAQDGRE